MEKLFRHASSSDTTLYKIKKIGKFWYAFCEDIDEFNNSSFSRCGAGYLTRANVVSTYNLKQVA